MHLSHHAQYKEPFGFTGILDWIHSTWFGKVHIYNQRT
jgi:hypothetical protein